MPPSTEIDRAFVRLAEGQVHLRRMEAAAVDEVPLYLIHLSPKSSGMLVPLMRALREAGCPSALIAPDTLGNGDSAPTPIAVPEIADFADAHLRTMDALGLEKVDLYGTHTGARIACEIAAGHPSRVRRVVLDGIVDYPEEIKQEILTKYAPTVEPDEYGRQLMWAFNFVRDQSLHFPYFMRDAEHRINPPAFPSPAQLHDGVLEVLKALTTYHKSYLAAFRYTARERLPHITARTAILKPDTEQTMLNESVEELAALLQNGRPIVTKNGLKGKAQAIYQFIS